VDPGFSADGVAVAQIYLPRTRYRAPHDQARFFDELLARLRGAPGVTTAGATSALPLHPVGLDFALPFTVEGRLPPADEVESRADIRIVTPGYVETLRIPLLRGRLIDERDTADAPHVMLINQSLARRYFGDDDPLGRFITNPHGRAEVVGVVGDVRHYGLDATPRAELYLPYDQNRLYAMAVVVRATGDAGSTMPLLRQTAADVDAAQPIRDLTTLDRVLAGAVFLPRASLQLVGAFALAALLLAAVGIYGVLAYAVSQQTRDIGVRMALGADRHDALRLVLARSLRLAAAGSVAGLALAWPATRAMRAALYDVDALDPVVVGSVVALLTFVALGAALVPGLRATRVEPVVALKAD
jgi:putative ABC transport system permease protein